jgi:hypothetical protein
MSFVPTSHTESPNVRSMAGLAAAWMAPMSAFDPDFFNFQKTFDNHIQAVIFHN